jgi:hypothetical protein
MREHEAFGPDADNAFERRSIAGGIGREGGGPEREFPAHAADEVADPTASLTSRCGASQNMRDVKAKAELTDLTSTDRSASFAESVAQLDEEGNLTALVERRVRETSEAYKTEPDERLAFEGLIDSMRSRLDLPRPVSVASALRNAELRAAFISEIGALTAAEVAVVAGSKARNSSALAGRWRSEGRIFAVSWAGSQRYPAFQFENGAPRPSIAKVLRAFGGTPSGWEIALWFASPSTYLPGDGAPLGYLDDADVLVAAARAELDLPES